MVSAFDAWWSSARSGLADLPQSKRLLPLRRDLLESFEPAMLPGGCLDRYALMGAIAGWWDEIRYELRVIVENGFPNWSMAGSKLCVQRWRTTTPMTTRTATPKRP